MAVQFRLYNLDPEIINLKSLNGRRKDIQVLIRLFNKLVILTTFTYNIPKTIDYFSDGPTFGLFEDL